jgi:hypothetical protein
MTSARAKAEPIVKSRRIADRQQSTWPVALTRPTGDRIGTPTLIANADDQAVTQATSTSCQKPNRPPTCFSEGRGAS